MINPQKMAVEMHLILLTIVTIAIQCSLGCSNKDSYTIIDPNHPIVPYDVYAHWSPVDTVVTYYKGHTEIGRPLGIYKLNIIDGTSELLIPAGHYSRISFDGTAMLYTSLNDTDIHLYHFNGSSSEVISSSDYMKLYPAWHPNGDRFYYVINAAPDSCLGIWSQDLIPGSKSRLIYTLPGYCHVSPSGKSIVFVQGSSTELNQYLVNYDITTASRDTLLDANEMGDTRLYYPSYSHDSKRILYHSYKVINSGNDLLYRIWIYTLSTGNKELIYTGGTYATWSPDGTHILFTKDDADINATGNGKLWLRSLLTGEMRQITF
jgi:Tol biopolymer transport system component